MKNYSIHFALSAAIVGCSGGSGFDGSMDSSGTADIDAAMARDATDGTDGPVSLDATSTHLDTGAGVDQASADAPIDAQTCPAVDASCGGNIIGTWHVLSDCSASPVALPACTQPGLSTDRSKSDTAYTFRADGTFTYVSSGTMVFSTRYPLECINNGANIGMVQACADFEASLRRQETSTNTYACAVDENQLCACNNSVTDSRGYSGTYAIVGAGLSLREKATLDLDGGAVDAGTIFTGLELPTTYCVSGDTLVLWVRGLTGAESWVTFYR